MSEHEAGRELDAMIAEKVFGLVPCAGRQHDAAWPNDYCYADPRWPEKGAEVRSYSTDIAEAWNVVEKVWASVVPKTAYGVYRFGLNRLDTGGYVCEFATDAEGDFSTHSVGLGETAALAICTAALEAVSAGAAPHQTREET